MLMEKSKDRRKYIFEIALAFSVVSLISTIWESGYLMLNGPAQPDYASGLVYPFQVKGPKVYISASDANCFSLCLILVILSFGCFAYAIITGSAPTDVTLDKDGSFHVGDNSGSSSVGIVFLASIVVAAGGFLLFGRFTGDFLAVHGVVLNF